ncbi:hypothetical protein [Spirillospora sp. NBC_01491]|uniref:hypothetical protein n=1 Tax=Spirillospora sp. NBC_01491 TaxID=2976007 RepID=UPI002E327F8B|nr:hypothetical protein [Spirillospora sp. NBC_01491]
MERRKNDLRALINVQTSESPENGGEKILEQRETQKTGGGTDKQVQTDRHSPCVFVPIRPSIKEGKVVTEYELRVPENDPPYLPAFSSLSLLEENLGMFQTWGEVTLQEVIELIGAEHIEINPALDQEAWRWTAERVSDYEKYMKRELEDG